MKKRVLVLVLALALSLMMAGIAAAEEPDTPVSTEISEEDNANIVIDLEDDKAVAEEPVVEEDYVGKDMELKDGEMGITAVSEEAEEDYVGKDMELKDGEVGITSVAYETAMPESKQSNLPLYGGILAGLVALGGGFMAYKKILVK
jgi:hypothetical protein